MRSGLENYRGWTVFLLAVAVGWSWWGSRLVLGAGAEANGHGDECEKCENTHDQKVTPFFASCMCSGVKGCRVWITTQILHCEMLRARGVTQLTHSTGSFRPL